MIGVCKTFPDGHHTPSQVCEECNGFLKLVTRFNLVSGRILRNTNVVVAGCLYSTSFLVKTLAVTFGILSSQGDRNMPGQWYDGLEWIPEDECINDLCTICGGGNQCNTLWHNKEHDPQEKVSCYS